MKAAVIFDGDGYWVVGKGHEPLHKNPLGYLQLTKALVPAVAKLLGQAEAEVEVRVHALRAKKAFEEAAKRKTLPEPQQSSEVPPNALRVLDPSDTPEGEIDFTFADEDKPSQSQGKAASSKRKRA